MIWTNDPVAGVYKSGYYTVRRQVRSYERWWSHPKILKFLGNARTLKEAKSECEVHARLAKEALLADLK